MVEQADAEQVGALPESAGEHAILLGRVQDRRRGDCAHKSRQQRSSGSAV